MSKILCATVCFAALTVSAFALDDACKATLATHKSCILAGTAAAAGLPADFDVEATKDSIKQCLETAGCGRGGEGRPERPEKPERPERGQRPENAEMDSCIAGILGMPKEDAFRQCMAGKGVTVPEERPEGGEGRRGGHHRGGPMALMHIGQGFARAAEKCPAAAECLLALNLPDPATIDANTVRLAFCQAQTTCTDASVTSCQDAVKAERSARCECHEELREQVGESCQEFRPERPQRPQRPEGAVGRGGQGRGQVGRGGRFVRAPGFGGRHGGRHGGCAADDDEESRRPDICAADFEFPAPGEERGPGRQGRQQGAGGEQQQGGQGGGRRGGRPGGRRGGRGGQGGRRARPQ